MDFSGYSPRIQQPEVPVESVPTPASIFDIRQRLDIFNPSDDEYQPLLQEFISHRDLESHVHGLQEPDLQRLVDLLDNVSKTERRLHQC